ncbi:MAG: hypothetical protein LKG15_09765 [Corynebacterium provencense]|nr:hypothetical protein [Corynebacterium provencense]
MEQSNRDEDFDPELDDEQMAQWEHKVDAVIAKPLATYYPDIEWHPVDDD